ncbi:hypothetical protein BD779DRAFT_1553545 [Infundibulicybe gibba]|nr:hypothetical protein BD779DRAFT_1553545 [Infundibulicybe gibba]
MRSQQLQGIFPRAHLGLFLRRCPSRNNHTKGGSSPDTRGSDHLFAISELEESEPSRASPHPKVHLEHEYENWTGDERVQDTILRMLIDKHKPLRTGTVLSAEQKLKRTPPNVRPAQLDVSTRDNTSAVDPSSTLGPDSWKSRPLLPTKAGHEPWHTTFKAPIHAATSIRLGNLPAPASTTQKPTPLDDRMRRQQRDERRRSEHAGRLTRARESTLDYRIGIRGSNSAAADMRRNPVGMKGWTSLVEDRIEKARKVGLFDNIKGKGSPIVRNVEESNPFIAREEFLMNRIIKRNGAAPVWVELQTELDQALQTFRALLQQSWVRHAVRHLTTTHASPQLRSIDVARFRDPSWELRERGYHDAALAEVNSLLRKYNVAAPSSVRRPLHERETEIANMYKNSAEEIRHKLYDGVADGAGINRDGAAGERAGVGTLFGFWEMVFKWRWVKWFISRWYRR